MNIGGPLGIGAVVGGDESNPWSMLPMRNTSKMLPRRNAS